MKVYCRQCKIVTNYEVLQEVSESATPEELIESDYAFSNSVWQIIRCKGCDIISFREYWETDFDWNPETQEVNGIETIYPKITKDSYAPKTLFYIPLKLRGIYRESIDSFNLNNFILCAAGLRAIIEGLCSDKGIKSGLVLITKGKDDGKIKRRRTLQGKIEGIIEKNHLTKEHGNILHEFRFLGNEALHVLSPSTKDELKIAIGIIEHTLENVYELSIQASNLKSKISSRKNR